jgi:hypothetical protein
MTTNMESDALLEQTLTVQDIAEKWKISRDSVRRIFSEEDGVLKIGERTRLVGRKYKRHYITLRIPVSVFLRVQARLINNRRPDVDVRSVRNPRRNFGAAS